MTTYLLTFSPSRANWGSSEFDALTRLWKGDEAVTATLATEAQYSIQPGDRLVWACDAPKSGLFATGRAKSGVHAQTTDGVANKVLDVEFDEILNPWTVPVLPEQAVAEALSSEESPIGAAGFKIGEAAAIELEIRWQGHLIANCPSLRPARTLAQARESLRTFTDALRASSKTTEYSLWHPDYFVYDSSSDGFAPAKWCGLRGMTPETYAALQRLQNQNQGGSRGFDGSRTRHTLKALTGLDFVADEALSRKVAQALESAFGPGSLNNRTLSSLRFLSLPARKFWWVNQFDADLRQSANGLIQFPHRDKSGNSPYHHNASGVEQGDLLAHCVSSEIRAISEARTDGHSAPVTTSTPGDDWHWRIDATYHALDNPIPLQAVYTDLNALKLNKGPISPTGKVNSGYLYRLTPDAMRVITRAAGPSLPARIAEIIGPSPLPPAPRTDMDDLNIIYYGPPGTGKTFVTARKAVEIIDGEAPEEQAALMNRFAELRENGQVGFVTFHQSYSYEEFVEGIRPIISEPEEADSESLRIEYECRPGAFRDICSLAAGARATSRSSFEINPNKTSVWKMSLGNTLRPRDAELYDEAIEGGRATLGYGKGLDFTGCDDANAVASKLREKHPEMADNDYNITSVNAFKNLMEIGDLVVVSDGNTKFRAIGRITGEYQYMPHERHQQTRAVDWLLVLEESLPRERILSRNFSQATIYNLKERVLKLDALQELLSGNQPSTPRNHVLIIDEINRGNIAKILGELITLLEPDKRIGAANEVSVTLPYSGESFGVPANLHVIGTMNTADRSIAFIDTALRRRFRFEEMMPNSSVVRRFVGADGRLSGIDCAALLDRLNERVELLYDRDHTIGHAYFLRVQSLDDLRAVFVHRVIPLLQEYFYGDWTRVALALGCPYDTDASTPKTANPAPLLRAERLDIAGISSEHDIEPGVRFSISPQFLQADEDALVTFFQGVLDPSGQATSSR